MRLRREQLMQSLLDNMSAMKRGMHGHMQSMNHEYPVSRAQLEMLFSIRHSEPVGLKALSQQLYMTPGAVSQLAEALEQHQLIERTIDIHDRRKQHLQVSKKGNKLLQDVEKRRRSLIEAVMRDLSDEELEVWLRVQQKMTTQFQAELSQQKK